MEGRPCSWHPQHLASRKGGLHGLRGLLWRKRCSRVGEGGRLAKAGACAQGRAARGRWLRLGAPLSGSADTRAEQKEGSLLPVPGDHTPRSG